MKAQQDMLSSFFFGITQIESAADEYQY